jgi:hypothetical protein
MMMMMMMIIIIIIKITETIQHTTGENRALTQVDYTYRINEVANIVNNLLSNVDYQKKNQHCTKT